MGTIAKTFFRGYDHFLMEQADITEITGTVDYYGFYNPQEGDQAYTTTQLLNLDRWSVLRVTTDGNVKTYEWATGQWNNFAQNWNNRATLDYYLRRFN